MAVDLARAGGWGRRGLAGASAGALAALAGCGGSKGRADMDARLRADLAPLAMTPAKALALWSIAQGLAEVAQLADPAIAPLAAPIIAVADPLVRSLISGWASAEAAAALAAHANDLLVVAAPAVRVVPRPPV